MPIISFIIIIIIVIIIIIIIIIIYIFLQVLKLANDKKNSRPAWFTGFTCSRRHRFVRRVFKLLPKHSAVSIY